MTHPTADRRGSLTAAANAVRRGEARTALELIDSGLGQGCTPFDSQARLLRAAALLQLGLPELSRSDLHRARTIDPSHPSLLALELEDADREISTRAAQTLLTAGSTNFQLRRRALSLLLSYSPVILDLYRQTSHVTGTVYWRHDNPDLLWRENGQPHAVRLRPDKTHPLSDCANVARVSIPLTINRLVTLEFIEHLTGHSLASAGPYLLSSPSRELVDCSGEPSREVLIIVPVYDDIDATYHCLESLRLQSDVSLTWRVIVVDDASPTPDMAKLLAQYTHDTRFEIISNKQNLGFATSVNRALSHRRRNEDILLLNSDTVIPSVAVSRLHAAAWSASDIGTVTPLSNNGEQCSFPRKHRASPLPSRDDLELWNKTASTLAGNAVVDMPNGVGFCLYVKSSTVADIGMLSDAFGRGYYEDVDYCLRARAAGWRNVCAVGIIVGHVGSRSFGALKAALVNRNLQLLEAQHPGHRLEFAAYAEVDPIGCWRRQIQRHLPATQVDVLIVIDSHASLSQLKGRARQLRAFGMTSRVMCIESDDIATLHNSVTSDDDDILQFSLQNDGILLSNYLRSMTLKRIEVATPLVWSSPVGECVISLASRMDILVLDGLSHTRDHLDHVLRRSREECGSCPTSLLSADAMIDRSIRLNSVNSMTYYFAWRRLHSKRPLAEPAVGESAPLPGTQMAVVMPYWESRAHTLISHIAAEFRRRGLPRIVLFHPGGASFPIPNGGNIVSILYADSDTLLERLHIHGIKAVCFPFRFVLPEPEGDLVLSESAPSAYFDFSGGFYHAQRSDCRLSITWSDTFCSHHIASWFERLK